MSPSQLPIPEPVATDLAKCLDDQDHLTQLRATAQQSAAAAAQAQQLADQDAAAVASAEQTLATDYATLQADLAALFGQQPGARRVLSHR